MKSVKPGRGPSMMSGIMGIVMIAFGVIWTIIAACAAPFMAPIGALLTVAVIVQTVYNFKNATGKKRYSSFDITDSGEEEDPLNARFGEPPAGASGRVNNPGEDKSTFCPYCGKPTRGDFAFCRFCGKKLP